MAEEKEYSVLGETWVQDHENELASGSLSELEQYRYFDPVRIGSSRTIKKTVEKEGESLLEKGKIEIKGVRSGFSRANGSPMGIIEAFGTKGKNTFPIYITFTRNDIMETNCSCGCRSDVWGYFYSDRKSITCPYVAGVRRALIDYLKTNNLGDNTNLDAQNFLRSFAGRDLGKKKQNSKEELRLVPRLVIKDNRLTLNFRFGEQKLYVIKNLDEFCDHVRNGDEAVYGKNTSILHELDRFTPESRIWYQLIRQGSLENGQLTDRMRRYFYSDRSFHLGSDLELYGRRLDMLYEYIKDYPIEYENRDKTPKEKGMLGRGEKKVKITMQIRPLKQGTSFDGVSVLMHLPSVLQGVEHMYCLEKGILQRIDLETTRRLEQMNDHAYLGTISMTVGRNHLAQFYYHVLPQMEDLVTVVEEDPELIHAHLIPDTIYRFFLDSVQGNPVCQIVADYGETEMSVQKRLDSSGPVEAEEYRDTIGEQSILQRTMEYMPFYDKEKNVLHCNGDQDHIYELMAHGIEDLQELGEVHCTKDFLNVRKVRHVKASVGVSVSGGMLELEIKTDDLSPKELLDILKSYRSKKKYYRLKDGTYVDMEDSSLEELAEMTDFLQLKSDKQFKEKMRLPMYRALYLNHLMEKNEEIYSSRDRYFKNLVKQFRQVKDADYEEPENLSKVMRGYQKEGFRWLKTLENCNFGGILADEMGLGKTLQSIAMLLSAKQGGVKGTSLIVCPASLVYNWEEELHRFAPELVVRTVSGFQEDRRVAIAESDSADVLVTSYDSLKRDISEYEDKKFLYEIIDEAQYIKNHSTAAAKTVKVIQSYHKFALTGTPVENRLSELWSIFDYLMPGFLYGYEDFRKRFELPIVKSGDEEAMGRLRQMTGPFILQRRKQDVLKDLPEKLEEVRYVRLEKKQRQLYDAQVVSLQESLRRKSDEDFNQSRLEVLAALTKLRQICCDPNLCFEHYDGETAKTDACIELIGRAIDGEHRMLVFSQFTTMLDILKGRLEEEGISYYMITGSTPKEERIRLVREFNEGNVPVFLISLKAGGVGLNLTGADIVIHYDPWWNVAAQNQATDRAHRIGQTKKVTVYKMIAKGTIEEKILELQEKKRALADQILGGESVAFGSLSKEDLLDILDSSRDL